MKEAGRESGSPYWHLHDLGASYLHRPTVYSGKMPTHVGGRFYRQGDLYHIWRTDTCKVSQREKLPAKCYQ
jgi:hypothetical protein